MSSLLVIQTKGCETRISALSTLSHCKSTYLSPRFGFEVIFAFLVNESNKPLPYS